MVADARYNTSLCNPSITTAMLFAFPTHLPFVFLSQHPRHLQTPFPACKSTTTWTKHKIWKAQLQGTATKHACFNVSNKSASCAHDRAATNGPVGFSVSTSGLDRGVRMAIEVQDLNLYLDKGSMKVPILKKCSMHVPEGQLWMLLGPNGCGKSTLLKALAGLLKPSSGHIFVAGPRSFVFQNPDHQVVMPTAEADVAFGLGRSELSEDEVRRRVARSLELVGMSEYSQRPVQTLSGGQKQRVAIAGALAEASKVLLLDELTTFLDETDQMGVIEAVRNVVGGPQAVTALWVTHRLEELEYADGAVYMEDGMVVLSGTRNDVKQYIQKKQDEYRNSIGSMSV